jgi:hypothetical protein
VTSGNLRDLTARLDARRGVRQSSDAVPAPRPPTPSTPRRQHGRPTPRPPAADTAALAALARELLADAAQLTGWVDADSPVGPDGRLTMRKLREATIELELPADRVAAAWQRALLTGLVEIRDGLAAPGWRHHAWTRDDAAVLRGWRSLFDAWTRTVPLPDCPKDVMVAVAEHSAQVLSVLHLSEDPVPLEVLTRLLIDEEEAAVTFGEAVTHRFDGPGGVSGSKRAGGSGGPDQSGGSDGRVARTESAAASAELAVALDWMLDGLVAVHAVRRGRREGADAATLTPLGNWVVRGRIDEICAVAQSPGGHTELDAAGMLGACARYSPGAARAEYRAWAGARPTDQAVADILDVARGDDPLLRGTAFEALRTIGTAAEPAVRTAAEDSVLRPYALLWLAERDDDGGVEGGGGSAGARDLLSRAEAAWLWVDTAAAVVDHGAEELLVQHLETGAPGGPVQLLGELRAVEHPRLCDVLCAAASVHPDPRLARALRRVAFRVR